MFVWTEYKLLGQRIFNPTANEAEIRTAISRIYYATYHLLRGYAEQYHYTKSADKGFHKDLYEWYLKEGQTTHKANPTVKCR